MVTDRRLLKRMIEDGPTSSRGSATAATGTMPPSALRTWIRPMSSIAARSGSTPCRITRHARPNRLKSLT
jgi:hypothetical protein